MKVAAKLMDCPICGNRHKVELVADNLTKEFNDRWIGEMDYLFWRCSELGEVGIDEELRVKNEINEGRLLEQLVSFNPVAAGEFSTYIPSLQQTIDVKYKFVGDGMICQKKENPNPKPRLLFLEEHGLENPQRK